MNSAGAEFPSLSVSSVSAAPAEVMTQVGIPADLSIARHVYQSQSQSHIRIMTQTY